MRKASFLYTADTAEFSAERYKDDKEQKMALVSLSSRKFSSLP